MRGAFGAFVFTILAAAAYAGSGFVTSRVLAAWPGTACTYGLLSVTCRLAEDGGFQWRVYATAGASVAVLLVGARLFLRRGIAYPFLALFGILALGAIAYDATFRNALVAGPKLTNDTFNVLRFIVFASFALTFLVARHSALPLVAGLLAILGSYAGALLAMGAFLVIQPLVMGAFELFLLYVVYAFGGFTLHLMAVSLLVSRAEAPPSARPPQSG